MLWSDVVNEAISEMYAGVEQTLHALDQDTKTMEKETIVIFTGLYIVHLDHLSPPPPPTLEILDFKT